MKFLNRFLSILFLVFALSCKDAKVDMSSFTSSYFFSENELKGAKNKVDSYPMFNDCTSYITKSHQRDCFEKKLTSLIQKALSDETFIVNEPVTDTIRIVGRVNTNGEILLKTTFSSEKSESLLFKVDSVIKRKSEDFPKIIPAKISGKPTEIQFEMPLIINVN